MKAVIFDMDGVVVDSERYWVPIEENEIFADTIVRGNPSAAEITGMNVEDVYDYLNDRYGTTVDRSGFVDRYDKAAGTVYTERTALMDGFEGIVSGVRRRGQRLALASSSPHRWIDLVLDRFDLRDAFDTVVSADDVDAPSKPEPDIYLHTADLLSVEPDECIAVEDSKHGVDAAKEAGMYCVGYRSHGGDLSRADVIVENSEELADVLERRA